MKILGVPLRAILVPLGVATISVAALAWYAFVRIPAQQHYLNERNLRLLRTLSGQIRSKVDNFDGAIDHAISSFQLKRSRDETDLRAYMQLFARDLEILVAAPERERPKETETTEDLLLKNAGDPPRVMVQRDEGRNYLYIGSKSGSVLVAARSDIDELARPYLVPGTEFDALLLVSRDGRVIAQHSTAGLNLSRLDRVIDSSKGTAPGGIAPGADKSANIYKAASTDKTADVFETLRLSSSVTDVTIGATFYRLYVQPVQLSLVNLVPSGETNAARPDPEEWALCGLVTADRFRAESSNISYTYLLWFSALLVTFFLAIPLVKLKVMSAGERLHRGDGPWVAASTFLLAALMAFVVVDVYFFRYEFSRISDERLKRVAVSLQQSLSEEVKAIDRQMAEFDSKGFWSEQFQEDRKSRLQASMSVKAKIIVESDRDSNGKMSRCYPSWACESAILQKFQHRLETMAYPYFDLVFWGADDGLQRIKWSTSRGVTPFVDSREERVAYYDDVRRAWRFDDPQSGAARGSGVSAFQSPTTGNPITVFWRALERIGSNNWSQSLAVATPVSLDHPALPQYVQFAVIDQSGKVMFHTDPARSLQENFFEECEANADLRASVSGRSSGWLTAYYLGRPHRLYVSPLDLGPFGRPGWSLVVFQDAAVAQTVNLETITIAGVIFAVFGAILAAASILPRLLSARGAKWFWPDPQKSAHYRVVALVNGVLGALFIAVVARLEDTALLLIAAAAVVVLALGATYVIVVKAEAGRDPVSLGGFWWARAAFLFTIAAVPAIASFQTAYDFEMKLLGKSDYAHGARTHDERDRRLRGPLVERIALQEPEGVKEFVTLRTSQHWDTHRTPLIDAAGTAPRDRPLDWFLSLLHRPYNDVAVDLKAAEASVSAANLPAVPRAAPGWSYALIGVGLVCLFYGLVRWLVRPLFALDVRPPPRLQPISGLFEEAGHLLLVGPPGSGKSTRLAADLRIRVFDLRVRAFIERRTQARAVPVERRSAIAVAGLAAAGAFAGAPYPSSEAQAQAHSEPCPTASMTPGSSPITPRSSASIMLITGWRIQSIASRR